MTDLEIWDSAADAWASKVTKGNSLRSIQLSKATEALIGDIAGKAVLDAGCGDGVFTNLMSQKGAHVTGVDGSAEMVKRAKAKYPSLDFKVVNLLKSVPFANEAFDL